MKKTLKPIRTTDKGVFGSFIKLNIKPSKLTCNYFKTDPRAINKARKSTPLTYSGKNDYKKDFTTVNNQFSRTNKIKSQLNNTAHSNRPKKTSIGNPRNNPNDIKCTPKKIVYTQTYDKKIIQTQRAFPTKILLTEDHIQMNDLDTSQTSTSVNKKLKTTAKLSKKTVNKKVINQKTTYKTSIKAMPAKQIETNREIKTKYNQFLKSSINKPKNKMPKFKKSDLFFQIPPPISIKKEDSKSNFLNTELGDLELTYSVSSIDKCQIEFENKDSLNELSNEKKIIDDELEINLESEDALMNTVAHRILSSINDSTYMETVKGNEDKAGFFHKLKSKCQYTKSINELKKNEKINQIYVGDYKSNNICGKSMPRLPTPKMHCFEDISNNSNNKTNHNKK